MKEALLVRFEKSQRATIRKTSKKLKISEAEYVRRCVEHPDLFLRDYKPESYKTD